MQFKVPDPEYMTSARTRRNFQLAWRIAVVAVALLWVVYAIDWLTGFALRDFGIQPRRADGLWGILFAPLLHGSLSHLASNSVPLGVSLLGALFLYPNAMSRGLPVLYLGTGLLVWLFARPANHIGASGLLYALLTYVFLAGLLRRDVRSVSFSLLVFFLYGGMAWGVLPIRVGVSFESHLAGAILGALAAWRFRRWDQVPLKRYSWEGENDDDETPYFPDPDDRP